MEQILDGQFIRPKYKLKRIGFENEEFVINRNKICVGRLQSSHLNCSSSLVSRNHAEIFVLEEDLLCVEDKKVASMATVVSEPSGLLYIGYYHIIIFSGTWNLCVERADDWLLSTLRTVSYGRNNRHFDVSNGTYINFEYIPSCVKFPLYDGDTISFGISELPSDEILNDSYAYKVAVIFDHQDVINVSDEENNHIESILESKLNLNENENACNVNNGDIKMSYSDEDCVELPCSSTKPSTSRSINFNNKKIDNRIFENGISENEISENNLCEEKNLSESSKSLKRKFDSFVCDVSPKKSTISFKKSFEGDNEDNIKNDDIKVVNVVDNNEQQMFSNEKEKSNLSSNALILSPSSCVKIGQHSKSTNSKSYNDVFNDFLDDVLLEVSRNEDLKTNENVVTIVDDNKNVPVNKSNRRAEVNKKSKGNEDLDRTKDLLNKKSGKNKVKDSVMTDKDIKEDEDMNFNLFKNDKDVIKSKKFEGKENDDKNNTYGSISENIKKRGKRRIENSYTVSEENGEAKKLKNNFKDEGLHEKKSKSKSKIDKATVESVNNLYNDNKINNRRDSSSKSTMEGKKDKQNENCNNESNDRNKLIKLEDDVKNLAKVDDDDVIIVEGDDHFENSDEEEFFCSQIFNTTDFDCSVKDEIQIKEEPQEEREGIDDNDVIIIDDDDDEENDDFEKWYGRLSQSFFETGPDEKKDNDTSKTGNTSVGNIFDFNEIIGFDKEVLSDKDKDEEKDLQEEIKSRKVKVMLEDINKKKKQKEVISDYDIDETSKKKSDRKAIFTEALPLPTRTKVNLKKGDNKKDDCKKDDSKREGRKKDDSKKDSLNDTKKTDLRKHDGKKDIKEIRREKLKAIADKNAEKKDKSKNESKPSTFVTKVTSRSRNDFLMESMVHENKTIAPRRSLRNEFKIPKIKNHKETTIEEKKSSSNEYPSSSNEVQKVGVTTRKTVVTFAEKPTIHYIDILPGSKLLPCNKKDAPLRNQANNENDINYIVQAAPHYSVDETLYAILRWKVAWLEVFNSSEVPNVSNNRVGAHGIRITRKEYKTFHEYFCIYQELLLHETWSHIKDTFCTKSRKFLATSFKIDSQMLKKVESSVCKVAEQKSFLVIRCHRYITEDELKSRSYPRAFEYGIITMQAYSKNKDKKRTCYNFCFIDAVDICRIHPQELYQNNFFSGMKNPNSNLKRINLTLLIKPLECDQIIDTEVEIQLKVISFIKPLLRLFSSITSLPKSPLQQLIFNPNSHDFTIGELPFEVKKLPSLNKLNKAQREAVISCTKLCLNLKPNMALIHGPPGTGKSHVIINIIEQMFETSRHKANRLRERPKVLLCAPSNLAVDLLVERLLDLREEMKAANSKMKLSIVRVGQVDPKNYKVASVGLERLAAARLSDELCDDIPVELSLLNARINSAQLVKEKTTDTNMSTKEIDEKLADMTRKKLELETITPEAYNKKRHFFDRAQIRLSETNILRGADIICSTLSSCVIDSMLTAFLTGNEDQPKITCCIIDEASQCCEPEIIIPAQLNVTKFVLVGDHKQLPATVISELSRSRGLGNSLFLRIFSCWESSGRRLNNAASPIHSLDTQYRMHPSIMNWPSKYFYNGALKSGYDEKKYNYPISHYMVLNHCYAEDPNNKECNNEEANLVLELALAILHANGCSNLTIGIITPYRYQRELLLEKLNESCKDPRVKYQIKINTVDGFQGTERDVIIMSCVRSSGIGFLADEQRLNVAVTRAKHSLIICANFEAFKNNQHWSSLLENSKQRKKYFSFKDTGHNIKDILPKIILK